MKGKTKILSPLLAPLLAIALMLSLVAGGLTAIIMSPAPVPAANGPGLSVEIISPEPIGVGAAEIDVSQVFEVRAIVSNNGTETAEDVEASIAYDGNMLNWVAGDGSSPPHTQNLGDIDPGCAKEVAWTMHCRNAGYTNITVYAEDDNDAYDDDTIDIFQMIKVEITSPDIYCPGVEFCPGQAFGFTVQARVTNTGADPVNVTGIELSASDAEITAGPSPNPEPDGIWLNPDESQTFTWSLHCTERSDDTIIVVVMGTLTTEEESVPIGYAQYAYHQRGLLVDIVMPSDGEVFCSCEDFYVNAVITSTCDDTIYDVWAEIDWDGAVELGEGETSRFKEIGEIAGKVSADVWWELHCTGAGEALITVSANGTTVFEQEVMDCDTVVVWQDVLLEVEIIEPPFVLPDGSIKPPDGYTVCECDDFLVKANVTNIGCEDAYDVYGHIEIGAGAILIDEDYSYIGDLAVGDTACVTWNLHCNQSGADVPITVYATSSTEGVNLNDTVIVHQGEVEPALEAVLVDPLSSTDICVNCYNEFTVTAIIDNPACALVENVFAELHASCGPGEVIFLESPTKSVGDIGGLTTITVSWDVECAGAGDVTFWVEAWADNVDPVESTNNVTIHQKDFIVEITDVGGIDPAPLTVSTCQEFTITARFINCYETEQLVNIQAILDYSEVGAVPVAGSMVYIKYCWTGEDCNQTEMCVTSEEWIPVEPTLLDVPPSRSMVWLDWVCPCCCAEVTWTLECVSAISGELTVTALTSGGVFLDDDTAMVVQEWKPHLVAGLEAFPGAIDLEHPEDDTFVTMTNDTFSVCQYFTVVATVTNIGQATAEDVSVTINVVGPASPSGEMTQTIGAIPGGESGKVWWTLHCDGVGDVTVTITEITGIDGNTNKPIPEDNIDIVIALHVHQVIVDLSVVITQPETCENFEYSTEFPVTALITNSGDVVIQGIWATLYYTHATASVLTDNPVYIGDIDPDLSAPVSWTLHCDAAGDVVLQVRANSTAPVMEAWSNIVTVHQWISTWTCIYQDRARGTELRVNTDSRTFQFTASDGYDSGVVEADHMVVFGVRGGQFILICHSDSEISLSARAVGCENGFCIASARDMQTGERYWLF